MSLFWRVDSRSGLLSVPDTNLEPSSPILPSSRTSSPLPGVPSASPPSRHPHPASGGQGCPAGEELAEPPLAVAVRLPSAERTRLVPRALGKSTGPSTLFQPWLWSHLYLFFNIEKMSHRKLLKNKINFGILKYRRWTYNPEAALFWL